MQMQIICSLALLIMNGAYLFVSYNMDEMVIDETEEPIPEVVTLVGANVELDPEDLLDLDIFDFDVEELASRTEHSSSFSRSFDRYEVKQKFY
jgi:hypothetical protein